MTDIDLQLVREFFELNFFQVTTHWRQHDPVEVQGDGGLQLYVENAKPGPEEALEMVLHPSDLPQLHYAVVEIRAWHTDRFYSSLIESNPGVAQFAEPSALGPAKDFFGTDDFKTILVVSELPRAAEQRAQAIQRLKRTGIDHLIEFASILQSLVGKVLLNGTYTGSPTLQVLQLLKRYRLLRNQQMEFSFPAEPQIVLPMREENVEVVSEDEAD
ncbi:MAG: hypothetical protein QGD90_08720 [Candidatus Hydrogenedentes bacterium]|nr:hypothetical protein [Candidatus Hydrogenedentota bacterium]